jgi:hypothetical protein
VIPGEAGCRIRDKWLLSAKGQQFMLSCDGALPRSSQNFTHLGEGSREPVWHAPSWSPEPSAWLGRSGDHQPVMRCRDACAEPLEKDRWIGISSIESPDT